MTDEAYRQVIRANLVRLREQRLDAAVRGLGVDPRYLRAVWLIADAEGFVASPTAKHIRDGYVGRIRREFARVA